MSSGWEYAMDAAIHCARKYKARYRVYAYRSFWGGWSYTIMPSSNVGPRKVEH